MRINFCIPQVNEVVDRLGLGPNGTTQLWHTQNILRRMLKYMPMKTGMFSTKQTVISTAHTIETKAPQAYYLYYGVRMVNSKTGNGPAYIPGVGYRWPKGATLSPTNTPLNYTKTFHPLAGPFWDQRLIAAEGDLIASELEQYIKMQGAKK